jgi:two-component system cell cycle sensor histidine kinase/response regulator CckA
VEAVELLQRDEGTVDVILLDLTMPRLAGRAAFDRLRAARPDVPVILFSGFDEIEATSEFEHGDLVGFIKKPFRPSELVEIVRGALGRPAAA